MSYVRLALTPDGGGSDSLARALPPQTALELLLDGGVCDAERLHALGVVNRVVPHGEALATAHGLGAAGWPTARSTRRPHIKRLVHAARGRSRRAQLDAERDAFVRHLYGEACGEGIAAFLAGRRASVVS